MLSKRSTKRFVAILSLSLWLMPLAGASANESQTAPDTGAWQQQLESAENAYLKGQHAQAKQLTEAALQAAPDADARSSVLNHSGVMHMHAKRFQDAERAFSEALKVAQENTLKDNALKLQIMSNLALAQSKLGRFEQAEELYKRTLEAKRKSLPDTASLASTLTNLANLYVDQFHCKEAGELYQEALAIDLKVYGDNHKEIADDYFNLGASKHRCNDNDAALVDFQKAHDIYVAINNHAGTIKALHYMALCHTAGKRHDKATECAMKAHKLHEKHKGEGHPDTLVHLLNAADSLDASGDSQAAEKLYLQALESAQRGAQHSNKHLAECNLELGQYYKRHKNPDKAEHYFKTALVHYNHLSKSEQRALYELPHFYSQLLSEQKRTAESEHLARKYLHVYAPDQGGK